MNHNRHESHCTVCKSSNRGEIERLFLNFESPRSLEKRYALPETSVYRHAKAFNLYEQRQGNLVGALEKIIEKGLTQLPDISASNLIEAIKTHAKLSGQWVDRSQELPPEFEGRSEAELEHYAVHGYWPETDEPQGPM